MRALASSAIRLVVLASTVGGSLTIARTAAAQAGRPTAPPPVQATGLKKPEVARALAILPGAGHLYAGERSRAGVVFGAVVGILVAGGTISDDAVECPGEDYSDEYCTSATIDALTYTAAAGVLVWSIVDAGRAARRTNARRLPRAALRVDVRPASAGVVAHVGVAVPFGGK